MARAASLATRELLRILTAEEGGVLQTVAGLLLADTGDGKPMPEPSVQISYVSADVAEKSGEASYPAFCLCCEHLVNDLREKFRTFSGTVGLAIDVRVSHDHADAIGDLLDIYVDSVTDVLNRARGEWRPGVYYPGGYEVTFSAAKKGGRNYFQTAKVRLELILSV